MAHTSRIPTPLKQHWNRFRLGALPIISFIACVILTLYLWERQARYGSLVGEVEASQWEVAAGADGLLVAPENKVWQLFDPVKKGEVIAYLDKKVLKADMMLLVRGLLVAPDVPHGVLQVVVWLLNHRSRPVGRIGQ